MRAPPGPGSVIRYAYLWSHEEDAEITGPEQDRPCAVVVSQRLLDGRDLVYVLPITSSPPASGNDAIEISAPARRRLRMQRDACWIVLTELNRFVWPGPDIRPVERPVGMCCCFGELPADLFRKVQRTLAIRFARQGLRVITRVE